MPYVDTNGPDVSMLRTATVVSRDPFGRHIRDRYLEDYVIGLTAEYGTYIVTVEEVTEFGRRFDPHDMHIDTAAARRSPFGSLIASGLHTNAMMMRIYVENYLNQAASVASPGVDELRWPKPVRVNDELTVQITVLENRTSRSNPVRGVVRNQIQLRNQYREIVMSQIQTNIMLRRRDARPPHSLD
ncbi:MaoC family dehydratase [Microbacterium sp. cf332]|uniref:MaoC family dehydratase n=1 Tax=Microbacterium sp. cf332 TaxID=1761804 RepID=UPI00088441F0|nr:MaoC family dehydratase [Microbacterium sp. cf332]SDQ53662.1 Acyl dehydratase [Microbacterium sp. cf332]